MTQTARTAGGILLAVLQEISVRVARTVMRHPRQSALAAILMIVLLSPTSQSAPGKQRPLPPRDRAGAIIPLGVKPAGAKLDRRGWWRMDGYRLSSAWMLLLSQARDLGWKGKLNSGIRTHAQQAHLYRLFLSGKGAPAFPPDGPSRHLESNVLNQGGWSQAVDVTKPEQLIRIAKKLGVHLYQPYWDEPWHLESTSPFYATQLSS